MLTNFRSSAWLAAHIFLAASCFVACKHDLDALKEGSSSSGGTAGNGSAGDNSSGISGGGEGGTKAGASGSGGTSGTGAGSEAGEGGTSGGTGAGTGGIDCECEDPDPEMVGMVELSPKGCCVTPTKCGIEFAKSDVCFPKNIPGTLDSDCDDAIGDIKFPGCCRPDGLCGVSIDAFDLGCVALADVPKAFGTPSDRGAKCLPACDDDKDCTSLNGGLACVDNLDTPAIGDGRCAEKCKRSQDCAGSPLGEECVFASNSKEDRIDLYCSEGVGTKPDGASCTGNVQCLHGACVPTQANPSVGFCSYLCRENEDCPQDEGQMCQPTNAKTPVSMSTQQFQVCR